MRETCLTLPELALIAETRAAFGAGLALLLSDRLPPSGRKALGWGLVFIGAVTTYPLAAEVFGKSRPIPQESRREESDSQAQNVGRGGVPAAHAR
jgi:hypothetical protein